MTKIPVFVGPRIVSTCDSVTVRRYIGAANAEVVRKRKTGQIVQVNLISHGDDSLLPASHNDNTPTYQEHVGAHSVVVLKRVNPRTGQFVRWSDDDQFNPQRYNPDVKYDSTGAVRA